MGENDKQGERFKQAAQDLEADMSDDALERVMGKLDLKQKQRTEPEKSKREGQGT